MTQHTELIDRLRGPIGTIPPDIQIEAAYALEAQAREIEGLQAARMAYASEFPPDGEGEPDVGSIHQNIRAMKAEIERLRKDAERYQFLRDCDLDDMAAKYWPGGQVPTGEEFDAAIDAANRRTP